MDPSLDICIFCLRCRGNAAESCSYGMKHEFPEDSLVSKSKQSKGVPKPDPKLCSKCGLHPKNPLYPSNGCEHDVPKKAV